ncbi:transcriptional regulator, TetR family [Marinobacter segnicrescens]|uniref:Transcriptional regulator, TetR family n=1 Tax=Marinobacter segnicrescens TaxID=430453 RepID=A0A1I0CWL7_9GAMM|nr:TetR/AcrR family transcriptional regulator [Marinobacter segnicrescens]SET23965.1 transcriptional regulator, TetR family [Marinobacter segnicrescens]
MSRPSSTENPRTRPLKRPRQARARFTVQAIYDAYVRIWQQEGWEQLTTRKVALETGIAIGTLYDYFPNKEALHSGYVRHCIEQMIRRIDEQIVAPADLDWQQRIQLLVQHLAGLAGDKSTWFSPEMMQLEPKVADTRLQQRAYNELLAVWHRVVDACPDLSPRPSDATLEALHLSVWGGRRYALQVELDDESRQAWAAEMERLCTMALLHDPG